VEAFKNLIPITAVIALLLFITRECLDIFKKRSERIRELNAYKALISEEIRQNYFALKLLNKVLKVTVKVNNDNVEEYKCDVNTDRYGNEYVFIDLGKGPGNRSSSIRLKNFSSEVFDSHISDLAKLDQDLYESLKKTYEEISQWKIIRNDLVCYLAGEIRDIRGLYLSFNFRMLKQEMGTNFSMLKNCHVQLTGKSIKADAGKVEAIDVEKT
jgi:hypothetical protein